MWTHLSWYGHHNRLTLPFMQFIEPRNTHNQLLYSKSSSSKTKPPLVTVHDVERCASLWLYCHLVVKPRRDAALNEVIGRTPSLLTLQFHTYWHQGLSWACNPSPSVAPWWQKCSGSERMEPHPWSRSNECCCHPAERQCPFISAAKKKKKKWVRDGRNGNAPSHRGKQHWCLDRRRAAALRCSCPSRWQSSAPPCFAGKIEDGKKNKKY